MIYEVGMHTNFEIKRQKIDRYFYMSNWLRYKIVDNFPDIILYGSASVFLFVILGRGMVGRHCDPVCLCF